MQILKKYKHIYLLTIASLGVGINALGGQSGLTRAASAFRALRSQQVFNSWKLLPFQRQATLPNHHCTNSRVQKTAYDATSALAAAESPYVSNHQINQRRSSWWRFAAGLTAGLILSPVAAAEEDTQEPTPAFDQFAQKYAPPKEIAEIIEQNTDYVLKGNYSVEAEATGDREPKQYIGNNPRLWVKGSNINRIINAERMRMCIQQHGLNHLAIPKKYLYKLGRQWVVFAEHVESESVQSLTIEEIQQLAKLREETGYGDWHTDNLLRDRNTKKLTIIDTENRSFNCFYCKENSAAFLLSKLPQYFQLEKAGYEWLVNNRSKGSHMCGNTCAISVAFATKFDTPDSNFGRVKREYEKINKRI